MREMGIHLAWMHGPTLPHVVQQLLRALFLRRRPARKPGTWMHQRVNFGSDEPIVDEKIFVDAECRVSAFQVTGPIVGDSVAQCQILRARRSADRISLDESELL